MKIIKPSVKIITPLDGEHILKHIEFCGRICYQSEGNSGESTATPFVAGIIRRGHESVLEHYSFTVMFVCDRGVSHELVRHRIASYSQESTRYCNYGKEKFGNEITFVLPCSDMNDDEYSCWYKGCLNSEADYMNMLSVGSKPEVARGVLAHSAKTTVIMTANLREYRLFFKSRCSKYAHPDMRYLALSFLEDVHSQIPVVFDDIWEKYKYDCKSICHKEEK